MSLGKLVFDTTDADTIADSHSVGAYVRASDGTLITHSDVGGKKALDVSVADGVNVEVDLSHLDDSVRLGDGTNFFTSTTENGDTALDVHLSNTEIAVIQGTDSPWTVDGTVAATQSGIWTVGLSEDHDYGAVGANTLRTAAQIGNATGAADFGAGITTAQTLRISPATDTNFQVNDAALADTAIAHSQQAAAAVDTAESTVDSILTDRKYLYLYNKGNKEIYIGGAGVDIATGFPVAVGTYVELRAGDSVDVQWAAKATAGSDLRALELS